MMEYTQEEREAARGLVIAARVKSGIPDYLPAATTIQCALTRAEAANKALREQVKEREMALALSCDLHGCDSCSDASLKQDGIVMNAQLQSAEAELARLRTQVDEARELLMDVSADPEAQWFGRRDAWLAANPAKEGK